MRFFRSKVTRALRRVRDWYEIHDLLHREWAKAEALRELDEAAVRAGSGTGSW